MDAKPQPTVYSTLNRLLWFMLTLYSPVREHNGTHLLSQYTIVMITGR